MSNNKFNQFLGKCAKDETLKREFVKDPEKTLKANGLNPDDIPDNVAEKMSAAGFSDAWNMLTSGDVTGAFNEAMVTIKAFGEGLHSDISQRIDDAK